MSPPSVDNLLQLTTPAARAPEAPRGQEVEPGLFRKHLQRAAQETPRGSSELRPPERQPAAADNAPAVDEPSPDENRALDSDRSAGQEDTEPAPQQPAENPPAEEQAETSDQADTVVLSEEAQVLSGLTADGVPDELVTELPPGVPPEEQDVPADESARQGQPRVEVEQRATPTAHHDAALPHETGSHTANAEAVATTAPQVKENVAEIPHGQAAALPLEKPLEVHPAALPTAATPEVPAASAPVPGVAQPPATADKPTTKTPTAPVERFAGDPSSSTSEKKRAIPTVQHAAPSPTLAAAEAEPPAGQAEQAVRAPAPEAVGTAVPLEFSSADPLAARASDARAATTQPTSSAEPQTPTVDPARFVHRIHGALRAAQEREGHIQLRLSPPELGSLRIEIAVKQGVLTAQLETETATARNLILDHLPALRERLAEQQISIEKFDVDVRDESSPQHGQAEPEQPQDPCQTGGPWCRRHAGHEQFPQRTRYSHLT